METDETAGSEYGNGTVDEDNSSVRVALRIRPALPREQIEGCKNCTTVAEDTPQVWIGSNHAFTYDHVFDQNTAQNRIFDDVVKKLVDGCLHGYNATILAYGQTGSGKTYTMGTGFEIDPCPDTQGIIPRAVTYLFMQIQNIKTESPELKADFKVEVNFVELYNEEVVDLLGQSGSTGRPSSAPALSRPGSANASGMIRIHEDTNGSIYVVGVRTVPVDSCHDTLKLLKDGALSRTTASTNMNDTSSRSHAIFTMHVTQKRISNEFGESELETLSAKFHFVDLAGSERLKRTLATGDRAKEGISINCGLLALGNVISALGDRSRKVSHVPYRDSKLTRLLQDSLGGNSRTVMIACVSPSDRDFVETLNTLKYANRARNIKNRITINQDKSSRTILSLRREIELLQSELLEFRQGKRSVADNYNDTHQENILLTTEIESLKSRLKSKQESIDKLTSTVATFETHKEIELLSGTDCDLTKMVQKYMHEIEDLRTKLYESEQECEKLRSKQRRLNTTLASPRQQVLEEVANYDILANAKADIESDRKKLDQLSTRTDTDDPSDSESDSEDQEKFEAIAQLTSEIGIKERLIEQLEISHKRVEIMRVHYEDKLECLNNKIKGTQEERDKIMSTLKNGKRSAEVNADYEKKIAALQCEVKTWQKAQKEHVKVVRNQSQYQRQIENLRGEVENLKQTKVKLVNQAKLDSMKFRDLDMKRMKEINSLKKDQRVKDIKLKTLENDKIKKEQVLKRKLEEVNNLKKINKFQLSRRAQGKSSRTAGSPLKAKSRWNNVQHEIKKAVSIKTTVSSLEKEMLNLIQERSESRKRLKELEGIVVKDEVIEDEIESVKVNLSFIEEKVEEIQNQIAEISSGVKEYDGSQLDEVEIHYVFKKMFETNIGYLAEIELSQRRYYEKEETNKQLSKEISCQRTLIQHLFSRLKNPQDGDDVLLELAPPPENYTPVEPNHISKLRKARRLTSTTQELLGSMENVSKGSEFKNPNDIFLRGSRLTQSLRVNPSARKRPQLQRQDTYNVADRTFTASYDPPEKLLDDTNTNSRDSPLNTTFLVERSSTYSPPSSSSQQKLTNSTDSNNYWDNTNTEREKKIFSGIRRISDGTKDRDKVMWLSHVAEGHTKPVISMYATKTKLFTGSKDSTAKLFDLESGNELACFKGHPTNVQCVSFMEETQTLFTVSGSFVKLWDTRSNLCIKTLMSSGTTTDRIISNYESRLQQPGEHQIQAIALRRNYLYTTADRRIRVWDLKKLNSSMGILAGKHSSNIMCLATAEDVKLDNNLSDIIVSGSKDHYIKLYVIDPDQTIESIRPSKNLEPPHYDGIESLMIKNTELYSGSRDTCIKKWDLAKAEMTCTASNAHTGWITGLSKLPDCHNLDFILSSSRDGSVKIWDSDLKEVYRVDIGFGTANYCVESLCVNEELVFTAGGCSSNSNNSIASNGSISEYQVGCWRIRDNILVDRKNNNDNSKQSL